jgi:hypothetical protein
MTHTGISKDKAFSPVQSSKLLLALASEIVLGFSPFGALDHIFVLCKTFACFEHKHAHAH